MPDDPLLYITTDQLITELLDRSSVSVVGILIVEGEKTEHKLHFRGIAALCNILVDLLKSQIMETFLDMIENKGEIH